MTNTVNFNGAVKLLPKVEQTIREREFFALQKSFKKLPEDIYIRDREIVNENQDFRTTFFECCAAKTKRVFAQLITLPKNF